MYIYISHIPGPSHSTANRQSGVAYRRVVSASESSKKKRGKVVARVLSEVPLIDRTWGSPRLVAVCYGSMENPN